jgi:23S rRNA (cytosine1962-C5)-methyltransferase
MPFGNPGRRVPRQRTGRRAQAGALRAAQGEVATLVRPLERTLARGHPWIWRDALRGLEALPGSVVTVVDSTGRFVARGLADEGPIGVRVLTTDAREQVDDALFARRARAAASLRARVVPRHTSAFRLVHGEGDRMPGVVCDVYGSYAVLRFDGAAALAWRGCIERALASALGELGVRSLIARVGRRGSESIEPVWGGLPDGPIVVEEHGMKLWADLCRGQKTGLFLDHRESRLRVRRLGQGLRVLNLYGYTGGFSVAAGLGGSTAVHTVDSAAPALALAEQTWGLNGLDPSGHQVAVSDVFAFLEDAATRKAQWDLIVSDPPSFAPNDASVTGALRSYARLHAECLRVLAPQGLLLAASCSSHVRREPFGETVLDGAKVARRTLQLVDAWGAGPDHPRLLGFPEGDYLKVLLIRALD